MSRVSSCRFHATSTLARNTASTRSGVNDVSTASSIFGAVVIVALTRFFPLSPATAAGLQTAFVSNGNGTPQVLEYLRPWIDFYKVDLKSFDDRHYRDLGGRIQPILDTIRALHEMGIWLELVTLLIPGFNDSRDELLRLTEFIAGVSPDIPWHVTAFHGDYKMIGPENTTAAMLRNAARSIGGRPRQSC